MTGPRIRSFRIQLTIAGFAAIYLPVLALFGVAYVSEDESVTSGDGTEVVTTTSSNNSGWIVLAVVILAPVALALAWWWAGRAVRPIDQIRSVAEHIEATDLSARIAMTNGPTEVLQLAASFDAMLDRLNGAANRQREAIDEISHELRTPIAVLVTNADVRLAQNGADSGWYRDGLEQSRRTAERMRTILDRLLVDARSYTYTMDRHPADLMEVIRAVTSELEVVAASREVAIRVDGPAQITGAWDSEMLARAVTNLLDNALRHSPDGGQVRVRVTDDAPPISIAVSNDGPSIDADLLDKIFDRSWSGSQTGGRGLGLAIARQIAEAHGGTLAAQSPDADGATTFVLTVHH